MTRRWLFEMASELSERLGFTLDVDPFLGGMARLRFSDGQVCYLSQDAYDVNSGVSTELLRMPALCMQFLTASGLPVPEFGWVSTEAASEAFEQSARIAERLGYPVILRSSGKPGVGPFLATDSEILADLVAQVLELAPAVMIQRPVWGSQVTVVLYGGDVCFAFERHPWRVVGDGQRNVQQLLEANREQEPGITLAAEDWRIDDMLEFARRARSTVPAPGEVVQLALKPSLAHGGRVRAIAGEIDPSLAELARSAIRQSGLTFGAVDLVTEARGAWLLDVQPAPDLEPYLALGPAARRNVSLLLKRLLLDTRASIRPSPMPASGRAE
ncbi:Cyanophycin synthetase [compost metagenome]